MINNNYVKESSQRLRPLIILLLFFIIGFSLYSNVLHGEFVSDDHVLISNNASIKNICNINLIWASMKTRFIPLLTFALNYHFNKLDVFWYHFVNITIHIINSLLVFYLSLLTFNSPSVKNNKGIQENSLILALISGGIFLCHPIQTQAVSFVTQRFVLFVAFFYLSTMILYIKFRVSGFFRYYLLSFITILLGIFSKESIVTLPFSMLIYEYFFFKKPEESLKGAFNKVLPYFIIMLILPMLFFFSKSDPLFGLKEQLMSKGVHFKYFLTEIKVLVMYLSLILLPIGQSHHHYVSISSGITDPATMFSLIVILSLLFMGFVFYKKNRVLSFCIFWFFITTSVVHLIVTIVNRKLMDEHWIYLSMAGVSIAMAILIFSIFRKKKFVIWASLLLLIMYSVLTFNRNKVWQTEVSLWEDVFWHNKKDFAVYVGLGEAYQQKGMYDRAEKVYLKGLKLFPNAYRLLNNLGVIYSLKGDDNLAEQTFYKAIEANPKFGQSYNNLAFFYFNVKDYEKALRYYEESLKRQEPYPDAYYYMGQCYLSLGKSKQGLIYLNKALGLYEEREQKDKLLSVRKIIKENRPDIK